MSHSSSTDEKLIRMANQIASFFLSQPERERVDGVASHINKFWEPRMRLRFLDMIESGETDFLPLVKEAATKVRRPASNAMEKDRQSAHE